MGDFVAFAVLGGSTMHSLTNGGTTLLEVYKNSGAASAVAWVITNLPLGMILAPLFIISMFIFSSTTYDSCTFVMENIAYKESLLRIKLQLGSAFYGLASLLFLQLRFLSLAA